MRAYHARKPKIILFIKGLEFDSLHLKQMPIGGRCPTLELGHWTQPLSSEESTLRSFAAANWRDVAIRLLPGRLLVLARCSLLTNTVEATATAVSMYGGIRLH